MVWLDEAADAVGTGAAVTRAPAKEKALPAEIKPVAISAAPVTPDTAR